MKHILIAISLSVSSSLAWAQTPQIGKSIGRSSYHDVEAMILDKSQGLDYVEVTMNNVIGKDFAGAPERAKQLMDDLSEFHVSSAELVGQLPENNGQFVTFRFGIFQDYADRIEKFVNSVYDFRAKIIAATEAW